MQWSRRSHAPSTFGTVIDEDDAPDPAKRSMLKRLKRRYEPQLDELRGSDTAQGRRPGRRDDRQQRDRARSRRSCSRGCSPTTASLAALISYFLILTVVGQAMQVATAREGVLGHLGVGADLLATLERWTRSLLSFTRSLTVVSILLRQPIAEAVGVQHAAVGGGARDPGRLPVARCCRSCAARCRASATTARRPQPDRRAGGPARSPARRWPCRARRRRRLPRARCSSFIAMAVYCMVRAPPAARASSTRRGGRASAVRAVGARPAGWAPIAALA